MAARLIWPLPNVWLGTSVEDQARADERIPSLLRTPAALRFLSCEPLLGPIDIHSAECRSGDTREFCDVPAIGWVIVGGESGPRARPVHTHWVRDLRDQCVWAGVPFFFKQWGEWLPEPMMVDGHQMGAHERSIFVGGSHRVCGLQLDGRAIHNGDWFAGPACVVARVGKRRAGAMLDGHEWKEFP